jgi:hypothetical protein
MNNLHRLWMAAAGIVLGLGALAVRADGPGSAAGPGPAKAKSTATPKAGKSAPANNKKPEKPPNQEDGPGDELPQIKVFRLRHMDPQVLARIGGKLFLAEGVISGLPPGVIPPKPADPAAPGVGFAGGGFAGGGFAGGGFAGGGFAGGGFAGGGFPGAGFGGGLGFMGGGVPLPGVRFAPDKRTRTLLVRGSPEDIQAVSNLVALLDLKTGQARPKIPGMAVFDLRNSTPEAVTEVVGKLGIEAQVAVVPNTRTFVVVGDEPMIRQVRQVVDALDVEDAKAGP